MGNYYDPHGGRPPRINQWNIAAAARVLPRPAVEVAYVGNRGVWEEANNLGAMNYISKIALKAFGLSLNNAADRDLLTRNLSDPLVIARGFTVPTPAIRPIARWRRACGRSRSSPTHL